MDDTPKAARKSGKYRPARPGDPQGHTGQGQHPAPAQALAQVLRHLEGVADGPPHDLGVDAVRQGTLDRAPAELVEHEVLGHALRVGITELRVHPIPEFRQPHAPRLLPPRSQAVAATGWIGAGQPGIPGDFSPDVSLLNTWEVDG